MRGYDDVMAAIGEGLGRVRAFPQRETGAHAPGTPEQWERLYLHTAQLAAEAHMDDGLTLTQQETLVALAQRALCCLAEERHFCDRVIAGVRRDEETITQALGKALGYPEAYPDVSQVDDGSVVVAPHVAATIAEEAAEALVRNEASRVRLVALLAEVERERDAAQAEVERWRDWQVANREARLAQPPTRNVVIAFEDFDLGNIEGNIRGWVGQPAPPDYASRTIGQPVHVALSQSAVALEEVVRPWYGALVTFATTAAQEPEPEEGDPELAAAPKDSYRDRHTGELLTLDDDRWVPFD